MEDKLVLAWEKRPCGCCFEAVLDCPVCGQKGKVLYTTNKVFVDETDREDCEGVFLGASSKDAYIVSEKAIVWFCWHEIDADPPLFAEGHPRFL